nr:NAD+ synthase [Cellvibrionaceae bacterium]
MNIVTAQLNYTIGDFEANSNKILAVIAKYGDTADIIVFSELCISGYYPKDLLLRPEFLGQQNQHLAKIRAATQTTPCAVVIGTVQKNPFQGKPFLNTLEFIEQGETRFHYHKQLLPTYGVFDEARHFEPGNLPGVFLWQGKRLGFLICEDAWQNPNNTFHNYQRDPVAALEHNKLDLIISINASPSSLNQWQARHNLAAATARRCAAPMVYVNQVGAIDELVFDGHSMVYNARGDCVFEADLFVEQVTLHQLQAQLQPQPISQRDTLEIIYRQLLTGLRDYCEKSGFTQVVIGCSGGIDSAVTVAIAALAMGADNVLGVTMPSQYSSLGSIDDSVALCDALGVKLINSPIKQTFETELQTYRKAFGEDPSPLAQENLQARIRGQRLMTYSNSSGAMVVSTGNKTELSVGYCTLYGDMAGGVSLLADLYKQQVYALAEYLNRDVFKRELIPRAIIEKQPSAELAPEQKDSDSLPPYPQLDAFLQLLLEGDLLDNKDIAFLEARA